MNQLLKALTSTHWAMDRNVLDQMSLVVLRHARGEKLTADEIPKAIGHDGDGDDELGMLMHGSTAVIPIRGVIAKGARSVGDVSQPRGTATGEIQENISRALNDPDVESIVLSFDSPGGDVSGIEATANLIYKARKQKPVVAFTDGMMASAAYWLASQGQAIFGAETSAIGSIGVFSVRIDSSEAHKMAGLDVEVISSGPLKGAVDGTSLTEDQRANIQEQVNDMHAVFVKQVARGRGASVKDIAALADGRVLIGKSALQAGFIDRIGSLGDAIAEAQRLAKSGTGGQRRAVATTSSLASTSTPISVATIRTETGETLQGDLVELVATKDTPAVATITIAGARIKGELLTTNATPLIEATKADGKLEAAASRLLQFANETTLTEAADPPQEKDKEKAMAEKNCSDANLSEDAAVQATATAVVPPIKVDTEKITTEVLKAERDRQASIRGLASTHNMDDDWLAEMSKGSMPFAEIQSEALEAIAKRSEKLEIRVGGDLNIESISGAIEDAISMRAGNPLIGEDGKARQANDRAREFRGMTLIETGRRFLEAHGHSCKGRSREEIAKALFRTASHSVFQAAGGPFGNVAGDYPKILENIVTKRLQTAYQEGPATWATPGLMRRRTVSDFKDISITGLGSAVNLTEVKEGQDYDLATIPERREKYKVVKYGKLYSMTWEMLINDDLDAFSRIPALHGAAAARLVNVIAWDPITSAALGATMDDDSKSIFHADHNNLVTAGLPPATATLAVGRQNMREQTAPTDDGSNAFLNLTPGFICVPPDLEQKTRELVETTWKSDASIPGVVNVNSGLVVVTEALLGTVPTHGGKGWYLFANSNVIDTIEVAFLEGNESPVLTQEEGFTVDGRTYKVRMVVGSKAAEFRGMWMNDGVT